MAEEDRPQDQPSLELPSFSLRRRRRDRAKKSEAAPPAPAVAEPPAARTTDAPAEPAPEPTIEHPADQVTAPAAAPGAPPAAPPVAAPASQPDPDLDAREPAPEPTAEPLTEPFPETGEGAAASHQPAAEEPAAEPGAAVEEPAQASMATADAPPTTGSPAAEHEEPPAPTRAAVREPGGRLGGVRRANHGGTQASPDTAGAVTAVQDQPAAGRDAAPARRARILRVRRPGGLLAATLTGLVTGLGLVGLTWAALRSCGAVRGTTSCGAAVGYPLVAVIFIAMVVVAALLLRLARVPEPTSTSLLGLGLTGVVALLFLVNVLLDGSMAVVIPLVTAGTFALSYTVTNRVAAPTRD
jgi:hypothetical protein